MGAAAEGACRGRRGLPARANGRIADLCGPLAPGPLPDASVCLVTAFGNHNAGGDAGRDHRHLVALLALLMLVKRRQRIDKLQSMRAVDIRCSSNIAAAHATPRM